nr:hypothetical protein [Terribacillus saccharophilus]
MFKKFIRKLKESAGGSSHRRGRRYDSSGHRGRRYDSSGHRGRRYGSSGAAMAVIDMAARYKRRGYGSSS